MRRIEVKNILLCKGVICGRLMSPLGGDGVAVFQDRIRENIFVSDDLFFSLYAVFYFFHVVLFFFMKYGGETE